MAEITGLDNLALSIADLNKMLNDALPTLVLQAAEIVEEEIRSRAPVLTGDLVKSLDAKSDRRKDEASAVVQIENSAKEGIEHYAIFDEYGTSHQAAKPFFRPGVEASRDKVDVFLRNALIGLVDQ